MLERVGEYQVGAGVRSEGALEARFNTGRAASELRKRVAQVAGDCSEAVFKLVEGQNSIIQSLMKENDNLHNVLAAEQQQNTRLQLEVYDLHLKNERLDATIVELITPLSWRK